MSVSQGAGTEMGVAPDGRAVAGCPSRGSARRRRNPQVLPRRLGQGKPDELTGIYATDLGRFELLFSGGE